MSVPSGSTPGRIPELDGLRGIAILLVVFYHYFRRFPTDVPFGDHLMPWLEHGYLGVHLFFMISGFVIAYTLERSRGPGMFIRHRFFRLWPAMLVCSVITFAVMHLVDTPFAEARRVGWSGFLPSLTFTAVFIWRPFLPVENYIDGAYWSLFVEVRFYFWAVLIAAILGARRLPVVLFAAGAVLTVVWHLFDSPALRFYLDTLFFVQYLPLFVVGVLAHAAMTGASLRLCLGGIALGWAGALSLAANRPDMVGVTLFVALFVMLILARGLLVWLTLRPLVWVGGISYSLYLLHQNIGVTVIAALPAGWSDGAYLGAVGLITLAMMGLAWGVFTWVERPAQRLARRLDSAPVAAPA